MTKGQRLLKDLIASGTSQGTIARSLGVVRSLVTRWAQGRQSPTTRFRVEFERLHGIPLLSWDQPAEPEAPTSQAPAA